MFLRLRCPRTLVAPTDGDLDAAMDRDQVAVSILPSISRDLNAAMGRTDAERKTSESGRARSIVARV